MQARHSMKLIVMVLWFILAALPAAVAEDEKQVAALRIDQPTLDGLKARYRPQEHRDAFLRAVMAELPLMRIRGHTDHVTFEYCADDDARAIKAIRRFTKEMLGPITDLNVVNLADDSRILCRADEMA